MPLRIVQTLLFATSLLGAWPLSAEQKTVVDLRVLVDVSGSMKKTDPHNLRIPAVRLLLALLPEYAAAEIWLFAQQSRQLIAPGLANANWKRKATEKTRHIHSKGLFTNIENALLRASHTWRASQDPTQRHIILLSDGKVDVSNKAGASTQSRQRLLGRGLARLQRLDVKIHTVALSADADHDLLRALSVATNGWYEQIDSAEQLSRSFLKLFEKTTQQPTLPLTNNKFKVDQSIKDMTLLVFHDEESTAINIITPNGQSYQIDAHPNKVLWHREIGFDLITVNKPVPGDWLLDANSDPDNRVMIVTNLEIKVDALPNYLLPGEKFPIRAQLLQKNKPLQEQALIERTRFKLKIANPPQGDDLLLFDNGKIPDVSASDGVYSRWCDQSFTPGNVDLTIVAEGPTFQRAFPHSLKVLASLLDIETKQLDAEHDHRFQITLRKVNIPGIDIQSVRLNATLLGEKNPVINHTPDGQWTLEVARQWAEKPITFQIDGDFKGQRQFSIKQSVHLPASQVKVNQPHAHAVTSTPQDPEPIAAESLHWKVISALVIMLHGVLGVITMCGYLFWRKRQHGFATEQPQQA